VRRGKEGEEGKRKKRRVEDINAKEEVLVILWVKSGMCEIANSEIS
jgi:hypothetical protein